MANYGHTTDWEAKRIIKPTMNEVDGIRIGDNVQLNFGSHLGGKGEVVSIFERKGFTCIQIKFGRMYPFTKKEFFILTSQVN
jgi:hypothetical protein